MIFDWSINVGTILQLMVLLASALAFWQSIATELRQMRDDVKQLKGMMVDLARQDQQLKDFDRRITILESAK